MLRFLKLIRYKNYQKWFSKQFVKRSKSMKEYEYLLKHYDKKSIKVSFVTVAIYDVLDNDGFRKLINSLYRLKKHKKTFDVETRFFNRKSSKTNYIANNQTGHMMGSIGSVKFKKNKWISEVSISYTYCNLSQVIIQYSFHFKRIMNSSILIHQFVVDEVVKAKKNLYFHSYANKSIIKKPDYRQMYDCDEIFFIDVLQAYICKYFYTKYGNKYQLPTEFCNKIGKYNKKVKKKINKAFLCGCYENNNKSEHLLIDEIRQERYIVYHLVKGKYFPPPLMLKYFSEYSMEFYYQTFYKIELQELEIHMRKYLNSYKRFVSSKDIKWLINKLRYIREQKGLIQDRIESMKYYNDECLNEWILMLKGKKQSNKSFIMFPKRIDKFEKMYLNNLEYIKSISSTQNNTVVIVVALATLFATIAGIVLTIIFNNLGVKNDQL